MFYFPVELGLPKCLEVDAGTVDVLHWIRGRIAGFWDIGGQNRSTSHFGHFECDSNGWECIDNVRYGCLSILGVSTCFWIGDRQQFRYDVHSG